MKSSLATKDLISRILEESRSSYECWEPEGVEKKRSLFEMLLEEEKVWGGVRFLREEDGLLDKGETWEGYYKGDLAATLRRGYLVS